MAKFNFTQAALENIQETGIDPHDDLGAVLGGKHSRESLLAVCLDGADEDRRQGWEDYVGEIMAKASQ